jgi:integrase
MPEIHRIVVGVSGERMVSVYLRPHKDGVCYYARYKLSGIHAKQQRYRTESLKTQNLELAFEIARQRYAEIRHHEQAGLALKTETVKLEIGRFMAEYTQGVEKGLAGFSNNMLRLYRRGLEKYWVAYLGDRALSGVTLEHMEGYELWRQSYSSSRRASGLKLHANAKERIGVKTLEAELNQFKAFLRWASVRGRYSGNALGFTLKSNEQGNRRSAFTVAQWTRLTGFMRRNAWLQVGRRGNDSRLIRHRRMVKAYVLFMKNSGLRVGEARNLRWMDVEFVHAKEEAERLVRVKILKAHSKVKKSSVVIGNEGAYRALWDWFCYRKEINDKVGSKDPIWCDVDGAVIKDFRESFNNLIATAGVEFDLAGAKYTIYSLRHTYITEQLKSGVPIYTIAANCNTSVSMIEQYYSDAKPKDFEDALTSGYRRTSKVGVTELKAERRAAAVRKSPARKSNESKRAARAP